MEWAHAPRISGIGYVAAYLAVALPFVMLDFLWLTLMGPRLYQATLGDVLRPNPNLWPAAIFYLIYPLGLIGFAVLPAYQEGSMLRALALGFMFGCFSYATYDLTNHATLRNWSTTLTLADICWGSVLAGCSATIGYLAVSRLFAGHG
ncbi:MAG: DUF2177 family protein [Bradyrhizobium sp.]